MAKLTSKEKGAKRVERQNRRMAEDRGWLAKAGRSILALGEDLVNLVAPGAFQVLKDPQDEAEFQSALDRFNDLSSKMRSFDVETQTKLQQLQKAVEVAQDNLQAMSTGSVHTDSSAIAEKVARNVRRAQQKARDAYDKAVTDQTTGVARREQERAVAQQKLDAANDLLSVAGNTSLFGTKKTEYQRRAEAYEKQYGTDFHLPGTRQKGRQGGR